MSCSLTWFSSTYHSEGPTASDEAKTRRVEKGRLTRLDAEIRRRTSGASILSSIFHTLAKGVTLETGAAEESACICCSRRWPTGANESRQGSALSRHSTRGLLRLNDVKNRPQHSSLFCSRPGEPASTMSARPATLQASIYLFFVPRHPPPSSLPRLRRPRPLPSWWA